MLGVVGESGAGKSMNGLRHHRVCWSPRDGIAGGEVWLDGERIDNLSQEAMRKKSAASGSAWSSRTR